MFSSTTILPPPVERRLTSRARPSNKGRAKTPTQKKSQPHIAGKRKTPAIHALPSGGVAHAGVDAGQEREELLQVHGLIAQIWHRNKNQHRGQKWWKWVAVLKRAVRDLVELTAVGERNLPKGERGGREVGEAATMRKRMELDRARREQRGQTDEWLREVVLGRCWLAFSTLVADSQFSTLGVVLLAILARVGKLVGLPTPPLHAVSELKPEPRPNTMLATGLMQTGVDRGEVVERACDNGGPEDQGLAVSREEGNISKARMTTGGQRVEEAGKANSFDEETVTVACEDIAGSLSTAGDAKLGVRDKPASEAVAQEGLVGQPIAVVERRKKRRKKGNAIDELFAGLS